MNFLTMNFLLPLTTIEKTFLLAACVLLGACGTTVFAQHSDTPSTAGVKRDTCEQVREVKLQGFHLGMRVDEVLRRLKVGRSKIVQLAFYSENELGEKLEADVGHSELKFVDVQNLFPDASLFRFYFFADKVYSIDVMYEGSIAWTDSKEYSEALGRPFNLPSSKWRYFKLEEGQMSGIYQDCGTVHFSTSLSDKRGKNFITKRPMHSVQWAFLQDIAVKEMIQQKALNIIGGKEVQQLRETERKKKAFKP